MQAAVLRSLEFDLIRDALAARTATPLGRARALALEPVRESEAVRALLAVTLEAAAFTREGGSLAISAPEDLQAVLGQLEIDDQPLEPLALRGLARFLGSVESITTAVKRAGGPRLRAITGTAASFLDETAAVERAIEATGDVSDRASAALRDIRESLRRQRAKLRSSLDTLARDRDTAKYLQDQIVTDRNGRYVLVVRAEHRDAIPGIVHGNSTSGASLYLEPLATVALNNEVVSLVEAERAEIYRILSTLTNAFRLRADDLEGTLDAAAELDELFGKVDLAGRMDGIAPEITDDGSLLLIGARHPLLIASVRDLTAGAARSAERRTSAGPVASTLSLVAPHRALVISGPNTGGKTVALKAFGLLSVMAQAGLLIPVDAGSRLTPFRSVFADIGDEQSISASLSTFSGHIANIVEMDRALELPALVLLDEVGGGTDPTEGGALGAAIVDHFRRRGALVVATTHDDILKSYAATTEGVKTAGFGFNPETYAPTYRLNYDAPGRSLALEIAERLGVPHQVITDARSRTTGRESQLSAHLAQLDGALAGITRDREVIATDRAALAAERQRLLERESKLTEREAVLRKRLDERLNEKLREARAEVDNIVGTLKKKAATLASDVERRAAGKGATPFTTGEMGGLRRDARTALEAVAETLAIPSVGGEGGEPLTELPDVGDRVFVSTLKAEGIVRSVSSRHVGVEVRGLRTRAALADLRRPGADAAPARANAPRRVQFDGAPRDAVALRELVVVGSTVDQALDRASKFLDDALMSEERRLRVVHGHGTGKLREALTRFFREHPQVASVSPAPEREGGGGATIVELKE